MATNIVRDRITLLLGPHGSSDVDELADGVFERCFGSWDSRELVELYWEAAEAPPIVFVRDAVAGELERRGETARVRVPARLI